MALLITFVLGLFFVAGALIIRASSKYEEEIEHLSVSIALGAMAALLLFDLLPEVAESFTSSNWYVAVIVSVLGVLLLMGLDRFIPDHEGITEENHHETLHHIGLVAAIAIVVHNMLEGMTVYGVALNSVSEGVSLAIGVGLHNIPMGMLIYSTLHVEKRSKKLIVMGLASISTFVGGLLMRFLGAAVGIESFMGILLCLALGMVIYIIVFELAPFVIKERKSILSKVGVIVGFLLVIASTLFE